MHKHLLLELRDTLIAHDDLTEVEPTFVWLQLQDDLLKVSASVPFQAYLRNKCIGFPVDFESSSKIQSHIEAALMGAVSFLDQKIVGLQKMIAIDPASWMPLREVKPAVLGSIVGDGVSTSFQIDLTAVETHPLLDNEIPNPPTSLKAYHYSTFNFCVKFDGRQEFGDSNYVDIRHGPAPL